MHKVFVSYHHRNDQWYKDQLVEFGKQYSIFWIDPSTPATFLTTGPMRGSGAKSETSISGTQR